MRFVFFKYEQITSWSAFEMFCKLFNLTAKADFTAENYVKKKTKEHLFINNLLNNF